MGKGLEGVDCSITDVLSRGRGLGRVEDRNGPLNVMAPVSSFSFSLRASPLILFFDR